MTNTIRYFSLDEAREEIKKRWNDLELKKRIEEELGSDFITFFKDSPKAISWKAILVPDNSFIFYLSSSAYLNVKPVFCEHLKDKFTSINDEKKNLGRLFLSENNVNKIFDICDIKNNENLLIENVMLRNGLKLTSFYDSLFEFSKYSCSRVDISEWAHKLGSSKDYYYKFLLHYVCHGVLFELFFNEDSDANEMSFTNKIIIPKILEIKNKFGLEPIIIKPYPENQSKTEDFYWWSFPPLLNSYLLKTCEDNSFTIKKILSKGNHED